MKLRSIIAILLGIVILLVALISSGPSASAHPRQLLLTPRGVTDQLGNTLFLIGVSNAGPKMLEFGVGTEVHAPAGWMPSGVPSLPSGFKGSLSVGPKSEAIIPFRSPGQGLPWRASVQTSFRVEPGLSAKIRTLFNRHILRRSRLEFWHSPEITSDHELTLQSTEPEPRVDVRSTSR